MHRAFLTSLIAVALTGPGFADDLESVQEKRTQIAEQPFLSPGTIQVGDSVEFIPPAEQPAE